MLSLWRNGVMLGELEQRPHPRDPDQVSGILWPTPALVDRDAIWQFRVPVLGVQQVHMPAQILGYRAGPTIVANP